MTLYEILRHGLGLYLKFPPPKKTIAEVISNMNNCAFCHRCICVNDLAKGKSSFSDQRLVTRLDSLCLSKWYIAMSQWWKECKTILIWAYLLLLIIQLSKTSCTDQGHYSYTWHYQVFWWKNRCLSKYFTNELIWKKNYKISIKIVIN